VSKINNKSRSQSPDVVKRASKSRSNSPDVKANNLNKRPQIITLDRNDGKSLNEKLEKLSKKQEKKTLNEMVFYF
jgi:signal recognition particle receptor subunit beta